MRCKRVCKCGRVRFLYIIVKHVDGRMEPAYSPTAFSICNISDVYVVIGMTHHHWLNEGGAHASRPEFRWHQLESWWVDGRVGFFLFMACLGGSPVLSCPDRWHRVVCV